MILSCSKISKEFVTGPVLREADLLVNENDKLALIGNNGAGKSTLLKIIIGLMKPDSGNISLQKGTTIGYLSQHQEAPKEASILDIMLETKKDVLEAHEAMRETEEKMKNAGEEELSSLYETYSRLTTKFEQKNGYAYKSEITGILKGLGFKEEEFHRLSSSLSGGEKTRLHLAKILLEKPSLLLLDEPTNHLDINSITWLESYLRAYRGAIILVSHDRYFLDKIATKVTEIEGGRTTTFFGNYTSYSEKKKAERAQQLRAYLNQQKIIAHEEAVIEKLRSFNREKSIKRAESRKKLLEKRELIEKPVSLDSEMKLNLRPFLTSGKDVLSVKGLKKSFGERCLFSDLNFELQRGERVAIIGSNGSGKTTILKIINDLLAADEGSIKLGTNVEIGYYDQEHQVLTADNTLFEEILDSCEVLTNTEIRNILASFLFKDEDVFKKVSSLSGGEKGRLSLARLMLSEANLLILDEPTNHLDLISKEILEDALRSYEGTVLFVSHDRYFINQTATRILELKEKKLLNYIGNYDYYLEKKEDVEKAHLPSLTETEETSFSNMSENKEDWKKQKEEQARLRKLQNELSKIEAEIEKLEERNASLLKEMENPEIAGSVGNLMEIHNKKAANDAALEKLLERWEEIETEREG